MGTISLEAHWSFALVCGALVCAVAVTDGITTSLRIAGELFGVMCCLVAHELGHAFAAKRLGIEVPVIILSPLGAVALLDSVPREPRDELWITLAGPIASLALFVLFAVIAFGLLRCGCDRQLWLRPAGRLSVANLALCLFNLLPVFPMDGGRVLRAILAMRFGYFQATFVAASVGKLVAVLVIGWCFVSDRYSPVFVARIILVFTFVVVLGELECQAMKHRRMRMPEF